MFYVILSVHFALCLLLVILVLLQQGKGADMGAAFGSGGSNSLFGAAGAAPLIVKLTTGACILFMVTSILLVRHYQDFAASAAALPDALKGSLLESGAGEAAPSAPSEAPQQAAVPAPVQAVPVTGAEPAKAPAKSGEALQPAIDPAAPLQAAPNEKAPSGK